MGCWVVVAAESWGQQICWESLRSSCQQPVSMLVFFWAPAKLYYVYRHLEVRAVGLKEGPRHRGVTW